VFLVCEAVDAAERDDSRSVPACFCPVVFHRDHATHAIARLPKGPRLVHRQGNYLPWPHRWDT